MTPPIHFIVPGVVDARIAAAGLCVGGTSRHDPLKDMLTTRRAIFGLVLFLIAVTALCRVKKPSTEDHTISTSWHDLYSDFLPDGALSTTSRLNISLPTLSSQSPSTSGTHRKALISGHLSTENVTWLHTSLPADDSISFFLYTVDDRSAPLHPPRNKGREAMVYLTFIIDHYTSLPEIMLFMHAHRTAWHNADVLGNDAVQMIRRLNTNRVVREGYMNLRCQWFPGCPDWMHPLATEVDVQKKEQVLMKSAWEELFPGVLVPETLAQPCCSQFAVSRDAVRSVPLEQWVAWRQWLLDTWLDSAFSGRVWEYIWQYVFTGESVMCPVEHVCYCDGFGVCFGGRERYEAWQATRRERDRLSHEVDLWDAQEWEAAREEGEERGWTRPDDGRKAEMEREIDRLQLLMSEQVKEAIERGNDPKNREMETGIAY